MKEFYIVHCIDAEGPLHETLEATFERINSIFQLQLKPSRELLIKLQKGQVDLGKITTKEVGEALVVASKYLKQN